MINNNFAFFDSFNNNNDIIVSFMKKEDIDTLTLLETICFSSPWSYNAFLFEFTNDNSIFLIAKKNNFILGYIGMHFALDEGYITNIAVFPQYRNIGAAKTLISALLYTADNLKLSFISLEVRCSNSNAISLYEKCGFKKQGIRKNFYEYPTEDAFIYTLYI